MYVTDFIVFETPQPAFDFNPGHRIASSLQIPNQVTIRNIDCSKYNTHLFLDKHFLPQQITTKLNYDGVIIGHHANKWLLKIKKKSHQMFLGKLFSMSTTTTHEDSKFSWIIQT